MNIHAARSILLKLFIAFLSLTAIIGIATVLTGEFGEVQLKVLATTFTISAASICAMACAAYIEKRRPEPGWIGIVLSFIAAAMLIAGMWAEFDSEEYWKTTVSLIVLGLAFAHSLLLQLPDLGESDWVQAVAAGLVGILALMLIAVFWGEIDNEGYYRVLAVVSIIVVLFTLVVPVLMFIAKPKQAPALPSPDAPATKALVLMPMKGDYYQDAEGAMYRVERVPETKT